MINIRKNVFETNSSSTHSISLEFPEESSGVLETIKLDANSNIVLKGGDFTGAELCVSGSLNKANLIAVYLTAFGDEDLKNKFEKVLLEHTGAKGIVYNITMQYTNGVPANSFLDPSIMGATKETYDEDADEYLESCLEEFVENEDKLKTFIFSPKAYIECSVGYNG